MITRVKAAYFVTASVGSCITHTYTYILIILYHERNTKAQILIFFCKLGHSRRRIVVVTVIKHSIGELSRDYEIKESHSVIIYLENNFQNTKIIAPHLFTVVVLLLLFTIIDRTQLRLKQRRIYLLRELKSSEIPANFIYELKFIYVIEYLSLSRVSQ